MQQKHLQNYRPQDPYNNELTSVISEPPIALQHSAGGTEVTEVTPLSCGVDTAKNDEIIAATSSSLHNEAYTNSVSAGDLKLE